MNARDRRALLVGASIVAGGLFLARGLPMLLGGWTELRKEAAAAQHRLDSARLEVARQTEVSESLAVRGAQLIAQASRLFDGSTASQLTTDIASHLSGAADLSGSRMVQQRATYDSVQSGLRLAAIRVELETDVPGLASWLDRVEHGPKLLRVRTISISSPEPTAPATQMERLRIEALVVGWGVIAAEQ